MSNEVIVKATINSFHYLYQDALLLHKLAKNRQGFERKQYCRTALLIYIFSLEGLINRVLANFLTPEIRDFFLKRGRRLTVEDKCSAITLFANQRNPQPIDKGVYPWSHFFELVQIRNDFVHPKHDRPAYYCLINTRSFKPIKWEDMPEEIKSKGKIKEKDLVYRQTLIPRDPYSILPKHLDTAKKVVDDTMVSLDSLLEGKLMKDDWLHNEKWKVVYPFGATLKDVPQA